MGLHKKEEAENYLTASTVVIVVDVNRPQRTECPQLLDKCKTIIVFDHQRRSSDTITGAVLSYVDPYASSFLINISSGYSSLSIKRFINGLTLLEISPNTI